MAEELAGIAHIVVEFAWHRAHQLLHVIEDAEQVAFLAHDTAANECEVVAYNGRAKHRFPPCADQFADGLRVAFLRAQMVEFLGKRAHLLTFVGREDADVFLHGQCHFAALVEADTTHP